MRWRLETACPWIVGTHDFFGLMLRNSAYISYRTRKRRGSSGRGEGPHAAVVPVVVGLSVSDRAELDNQ